MKKLLKYLNKSSKGTFSSPERSRMARSMPGETAALASLRYGGMSI